MKKYFCPIIKKNKHIFSRINFFIFAVFFILLAADCARADIYKYVDEDGVLHLTNVPTNSKAKYTLIMKERRILFRYDIDVTKFDEYISNASNKHNIDPALIRAIIKAESNFNHRAVSPVGAQGLMQLMPATASQLNVEDAFHPEQNIDGGVRYLSYLLKLYRGNLTLALAAYNAGEGAVAKYHYQVPPYRETKNYVKRVMNFYNSFRR